MSNKLRISETYHVGNEKFIVVFKDEDKRISFNQFVNSDLFNRSRNKRSLFTINASLRGLEVKPLCMTIGNKLVKNAMYQLMDLCAEKIVKLKAMDPKVAAIDIMKRTGSEYLASRYNQDFSSRYLNSDTNNMKLLLRYCGIDATEEDCEYMRVLMLYFNNNSLEQSQLHPQRFNIDLYGNGENWCVLWLKLSIMEKDMLLDTILKWKG